MFNMVIFLVLNPAVNAFHIL